MKSLFPQDRAVANRRSRQRLYFIDRRWERLSSNFELHVAQTDCPLAGLVGGELQLAIRECATRRGKLAMNIPEKPSSKSMRWRNIMSEFGKQQKSVATLVTAADEEILG
jgi:hypothetical protein